MNDQQLLRYSRHILLNEIGIENQEKLLQSTALVIGCGGLGSAALPYLAAAGLGKIIIADLDTIDDTNLQRQIPYAETDIGSLKAEKMAQFLQQRNPSCQVEVHTQYLGKTELNQLAQRADVVLDCSDNFATRQAINAACVAQKKPLVSGAAVRFDGQLAVYRPDLGCYACVFDMAQADDGACALFGVFSPLVGVIGSLQAVDALKILMGLPVPNNVLRCYSALTGEWQNFKFAKNPRCTVCGTHE
ncbi:HesA/MoeB/ThiF family protein [Kingella negevensis]|uniref:HesA/MoeB/ThiF family protein n=1 Tax=Kingella negevensis TaxID=1522312 RepID=UPI00050A2B95|nr:HesA/MoeB/ThiF family protein [Kingella negevensis]MDK4689649.1 HesA/MoeB/ThiF family protein [Kingella negevensis]WII91787.1 HesA/MoeB/ThiF family protein [Kingella negevensis]